MLANRSLFATLALAFALVLVGAACTETASGRAQDLEPAANGVLAAETPAAEEESHEAEEAHADDESDEAEAAHADDEDHAVEAGGRVIEVTMSEFSFDPGTVDVTAGETVTFVVTNAGVVEHEFRLSNAHRIEEHIASGHAEHNEQAAEGGHHGDGDMILLLPAGETGEMTVTFPSDTTVYTHTACLIPGHYEAGMSGEVSYTA